MPSNSKPVPTSVRIPSEIDDKLEKILEREHVPKTSLIIKAVEYFVATDGKLTSDGEYIKNIKTIEQNFKNLNDTLKEQNARIDSLQNELKELRCANEQQNSVIEKLISLIPRGE